MTDINVTLGDSTREAIETLEGGVEHFVAALAVRIRDNFRDNVAVATGATQASASVITADSSDYAANVAAARALNSKASFAPEATAEGRYAAVVQVPIDYAGIGEIGLGRRAAHPALVPAVESAVSQADAIAREVFGL